MQYNSLVLQHFYHPQYVGSFSEGEIQVGTGKVEAANGNVLVLQIKVEDNCIVDVRFKAYGCVATIAISSWICATIKGLTLAQAYNLSSADMMPHLKLPSEKLHCLLLAEDALKAAVDSLGKKAIMTSIL